MLKKISVLVLILLVTIALFLVFGNKDSGNHDKNHVQEAANHSEGHGNRKQIKLDQKQIEEFEIEISEAKSGKLSSTINLTGEITINQDKLAHVVSPVSGIVTQVIKTVGDDVNYGEVLAIIESPELAEAQEKYLSLIGSFDIAKSNFDREQKLIDKQLTTQEEYLHAKLALTQAEHGLHAAEQQLKIYALTDTQIKEFTTSHEKDYSRYISTAPLSGTIIEKHITLGEILEKDTKIFDIADLSTVWVDLNVYQKDFAYINKGQKVIISIGHGIPEIEGTISYVSPIVGEGTRTAIARVILPNASGNLRPGLFINAKVNIESNLNSIIIQKSSLQKIEGQDVIFIKTEDAFELREVELGRPNSDYIEIVKGINVGENYVSEGSFTLKSELLKSTFGEEEEY